ncbi:uncharacterized protein LOC132740007 [Ruditapes philippinarum]|uniref:uncharacterized protein LOC132740007 n=1 Tax=Ruditapes philippinarum TaxID=129788 RepID=UPI00295B1F24|nr:uncharacterized protein LOC132740007 [Ruditapes philippinarum]
MVTVGNERYLRSVLYLSDSGSYITKEVIQRELERKDCTLDELLNDTRQEKKVKNEFRNKMQQDILYPASGKTDIKKWDIQMLSGVIMILFGQDLQPKDRTSVREIKRRRIMLAHSSSAEFCEEDYNNFVEELNDAITTIASDFEDSIQEKCRETFDKYKTCPLEVTTSIEKLKYLNATEPLISKILDSIESAEKNLSDTIRKSEINIRSDIQGINLVLERLEKKMAADPFKKIRMIVNTRLTFSGNEEPIVDLADKIVLKVINRAIAKVKNTENMVEIERAVDDILKHLDEMEGVEVLSTKPECIIISLQCDTYSSVYELLKYTTSEQYRKQLNSLAEAVDLYIKCAKPFTAYSEITTECLQDIENKIETDTDKDSESKHDEEEECLVSGDPHFTDTVHSHADVDSDKVQDDEVQQSDTAIRSEGLVHSPGTDDIQDLEQQVRTDNESDTIENIENEETHVYKTSEKMIVAAIDIGSKFTAMAYSFGADFKRDHLNIHVYHDWTNSTGIQTDKVSTVALFDDNGKFHSFGYEAEIKYAELLEQAEEGGTTCLWRIFRDLSLTEKQNSEYAVKDDQTKPMAAMDVYVAVVMCLKSQMFRYLKTKLTELKPHDIHWILTVPSHESETMFLKEVANRAKDEKELISFVLKPEAATLYCKELKATKDTQRRFVTTMQWIKLGERFIVVDAGYNTFSVTFLKLEMDGSIAEIETKSQFYWSGAGQLVNEKLELMLEEIFGRDVLSKFREGYKLDALELKDTMEMMKTLRKDLENEKEDYITPLKIPSSLLHTFKEINGFKFSDRRESLAQTVHVPSKGSRIYFSNETVIDLFNGSKKKLVDRLRDLLKESELRDVMTIVFIGGLADPDIIRNELRHSFHRMNLIFPDKASTAAVKGAVIYEHTTNDAV